MAQYQPTLEAPELVDINYKKALTSKVDDLLRPHDIEKIKTNKEKSIERVVTDTALRINKNKPYHLDQRRRSPSKYKAKGLLKGTKGTLEENRIPDRDLIARYHDEQYKLFSELSKRFSEPYAFLKSTKQQKDEKELWFLYRSGKKLKTTQFLNYIDKISQIYIHELKVLDVKLLTPSDIKEKEGKLETIAKYCETIVMARYLCDITTPTNFMKDDKTNLWRNHVAVILSFAALLVILEMFKLKLCPKSKRNGTRNETSSSDSSDGLVEGIQQLKIG